MKKGLYLLFNNKNRRRILLVLFNKGSLSVSGIQKEIAIDYRTTWEHLEYLKKEGLIDYKKGEGRGQPKIAVLNKKELAKKYKTYTDTVRREYIKLMGELNLFQEDKSSAKIDYSLTPIK